MYDTNPNPKPITITLAVSVTLLFLNIPYPNPTPNTCSISTSLLIATSVLIHFGPFYKDRTDKGPTWQRTEVDVQIGTKDRSG